MAQSSSDVITRLHGFITKHSTQLLQGAMKLTLTPTALILLSNQKQQAKPDKAAAGAKPVCAAISVRACCLTSDPAVCAHAESGKTDRVVDVAGSNSVETL